MFVLAKISDLIRIEPSRFQKPTPENLEEEINRKYAGKVVHNTGLCICMYDIESYGDGLLKHGDGAVFVETVFRMIVFRPFVGEILVGWVSSCTEEGINVKMDFFDDIHIPKTLLFESCVFIPREQAWLWKTADFDFYIDANEKIRFRVEQEVFTQQQPKPGNEQKDEPKNQIPPYALICSCQTDGMGLVSWWE